MISITGRKRSKKKQGGFALIELMIVFGIIGILAAIGNPAYNAYKEQSYIALCLADSKNAFTAAQNYFMFECDQ